MQPAFQHAAAHRRDRTIEDRRQRVVAAAGQALRQLQIAAGRGVHDDAVLLALHGEAANVRQRSALGIFDVLQQAAGGAQRLVSLLDAETGQVAGTELQVELLTRGLKLEFPQWAAARPWRCSISAICSKVSG